MATYTYKPNRRLISASKANGKVSITEIGVFDKNGEYKTTAKGKTDKLDKAAGISRKGA
jgi:hypothetical protein